MSEFLAGASAFVFLMVAAGLVCVLRRPGYVDRMMAMQLFATGGVAALLLMGASRGMDSVINVVLTLSILAAFAAIAFVRAGLVLVEEAADTPGEDAAQ